jgi:hypothetical protein
VRMMQQIRNRMSTGDLREGYRKALGFFEED